jgi:hypothetical protein
MNIVIVSRHAAACQFVASELNAVYAGGEINAVVLPDGNRIPVLSSATPADVQGKVVYGNLPLHLAALAAEVRVIEFEGNPPRGQEYDLAAMKAAGAVIRAYRVARCEN